MGGIAAIARAAGHRVTGSDRNVYPPMSTQLAALGIELTEGYEAAQLDARPDIVVVGNVCTRGMPVIEALLERGIPYASGPEWLAHAVLADRWVLAVAGPDRRHSGEFPGQRPARRIALLRNRGR
jgi:UDP-N-acetylmuramate: L-alanyl-gamma-D-glutamyl-meso-diaminopimelate ligase